MTVMRNGSFAGPDAPMAPLLDSKQILNTVELKWRSPAVFDHLKNKYQVHIHTVVTSMGRTYPSATGVAAQGQVHYQLLQLFHLDKQKPFVPESCSANSPSHLPRTSACTRKC